MSNNVDSGYGFIYAEQQGGHYLIDFYIPSSMLADVQLVPGSTALLQGPSDDPQLPMQLRPAKGTAHALMGKHAFIASVRLANQPAVLREFLQAAHKRRINFSSIRTKGLRGAHKSDVMCEGALHDWEPLFVREDALRRELNKALAADTQRSMGDITAVAELTFGTSEQGLVHTSRYHLDIPLFRAPLNRIRFSPSHGHWRWFKSKERVLLPVRIQLDTMRMTIEVDQSFADLRHYAVVYRAARIEPASPVTQTILELLPPRVNVEGLDAFEYLDWNSHAGIGTTERLIESTGIIEILLTTPGEDLDESAVASGLRDQLTERHFSPEAPHISVTDLNTALLATKSENVPDDSSCTAFRKLLGDGRYAFVEPLGKGAAGAVNKYLDLHTSRMVAGKHILKHEGYREDEVRALKVAAEQKASRHAAVVHDYFKDGSHPVIIMDCADNTLNNHVLNAFNRASAKRHSQPGTIGEFSEMMRQLLEGLRWFHEGGTSRRVRLIHADVKPENIGFIDTGEDVIWKLLDLGVSRSLPIELIAQHTSTVVGTYQFMSPQVLHGDKMVSNDIYALGIVGFIVLCGWNHPSETSNRSLWEKFEIPIEVVDYWEHLRNPTILPKPPGFTRSKWQLAEPFKDLNAAAEAGLAEIIYDMIALDDSLRIQDAAQALKRLSDWRLAFL